MPSKTVDERFWEKVGPTEEGQCWVWLGSRTHGYGRFRFEGEARQAHRIAYEWLVGPIPEGLVIDHLCRNRACVNPAHMEPVTSGENSRRGYPGRRALRKTHCKRGHLLAGANVKVKAATGKRQCLVCLRAHWARRNAERSAELRSARLSNG